MSRITQPFSLFLANYARAVEIDRRARAALADSLGAVFDACREHLTAEHADQFALLGAIRAHPVAPCVFGTYAELVDAVSREDYLGAQQLMNRLMQPQLRSKASARVVTLDEGELGDGVVAMYIRCLDDDPDKSVAIGPVDGEELVRGRRLLDSAKNLLHDVAPELGAEIGALAHETVFVSSVCRAGEESMGFDGACTFYLWGAVVLNIARRHSRTGLATALVHEAGHAYLLGSTLGMPLVENDPAERYTSPLRSDPRPMDGLVHASFVLARMIWCQDRMMASGLLNSGEQRDVQAERSANHARFVNSASLITSCARFTSGGRELWIAARDWFFAGCPA
jgi:hypothetical protein